MAPDYRVTDEIGPDHDKRFIVEMSVNGNVMGTGEGRTKKEAEQKAARAALKVFYTKAPSPSQDASG